MSTCRNCGARIRWVTTAKRGRWMPLDPEPTPLGTVILIGGEAFVLDIPDRDRAVERGETIWRPHFASCPKNPRRRDAAIS